ncbi:MAG: response regulator [Roseiflexaceae bacterium]
MDRRTAPVGYGMRSSSFVAPAGGYHAASIHDRAISAVAILIKTVEAEMSPSGTPLKILLLEDDPGIVEFLEVILAETSAGFQLTHVLRLADALQRLSSATFDVVLLDLGLEDSQGIDTLVKLYAHAPATPIVVLTGLNDEQLGTRLLQEGAQDYLIKGQVDGPTLSRSMRYAVERKRIEEALRESEMRYRVLVEHMPAITYITPPDDASTTLYVSAQIEAALGFSQDEWMADRQLWSKQIHPDDHDQALAGLQLARSKDAPASVEYRILTRDGRVRWFHDTGTVIRDHTGQPLFLQGVVLDITESKYAEQALRESEARYRTLVENLPLSVCEIDRDGRLLSMNQAGLQMIGAQDSAQVPGSAYQEVIPGAEPAQFAILMARASAGEVLEIEHTGNVNGATRVFTTTLIPQRDADGVVYKIVGTTQDMTEQFYMRLEAEQDHDRFDAILESSNDAILMVDLDGHIAMVNRAFSIFFGVEPDGVIRMSCEYFFNERWDYFEQPRQFQAAIEALLQEPQHEVAGEVTVLRPMKRMLAWYSAPVRTRAATILGRLFIFRDATREKEADLLKAEFISIVSHELRTPLTSIKGFTDLILEGDAGEIGAEVREFLEIVKVSADQLVEITDDILEAAQIEAGKIKLSLQQVELDEIAHAVALSMQMMAQSKGQTITVDLPLDLPELYADRERLAQIFTNLLSNAHKYTPAGGRIGVSARLVEEPAVARLAQTDAVGPWVVVSVADTGIGIAPEDQQHLFSRFYRVSSPETQGIGGTGLGLHITRSLVELQGGAIWIESVPGRGSTFSFSLPVARHAPIHLGAEAPTPDTQRQLVLLVEPKATLARLLQGHLEQAGYAVVIADEGRAALARACAERPVLILLAIQLPDMDGYTLIERLHADERTTEIPVIVIATIEEAERAPRLGVAGYLSEPIDERSLLDIVHAALVEDRRSIALVVDDDPQVVKVLTALLAKRGYNAFAATDGQQGLTLATRLQPSLVLLDLWMPGLNGFQVLNVLRQHPATRGIPVIALNDSDIALSALRRVLALGAIDLLTKPPDVEALQRLVVARLDLMELVGGSTTFDSEPHG